MKSTYLFIHVHLFRIFKVFTDGTNCVTNAEDFQTLCLNPVVLRNVLVGLSNVHGDHWDRENK
jgi:hypothetical protein